MDVRDIKSYLYENKEDIIKILKHFKFHSMHEVGGNILCGRPGGSSDHSCSVKLDEKLTSSAFSLGFSGDMFGMIAKVHDDIEWVDVLYTCELIINKKIEQLSRPDLFDGLLDYSYKDKSKIEYLTYGEEILDEYLDIWNYRFAIDNISPTTQKFFNIRYADEERRIVIPWKDENGDYVGIISRANYETESRYFPFIPFLKSLHLYGLYENKEYIKKTKTCYIGEAEKFVMQLHSYNIRNAVAIGCSTISQMQVELLIRNGCRNFILCHDEGSEIEVIKRNVEMIKDCMFMIDDYKIGIIIDKKNEILIEGSKASPSDYGKKSFEKLANNYIKWSK